MSVSLQISTVYRRFLDALRTGNRAYALRVSQLALATGIDVRSLYLDVFQPAMYEIGRLWELNQLSVAQEHLATAITRSIMAQIHALATTRLTMLRMFMSALKRTVITTCVSNELHDLGIRMVADFFELEGWRVYHLGALVPAQDVVQMISEKQADVLAISVTIRSHMPLARDMIQLVRTAPSGSRVRIIVGGQPFNLLPDLYRKIGADLMAPDAQTAVSRVTESLQQTRLVSPRWVMPVMPDT